MDIEPYYQILYNIELNHRAQSPSKPQDQGGEGSLKIINNQ